MDISIIIVHQDNKEELIKSLDILDEKYKDSVTFKFEVIIIQLNVLDKLTDKDVNTFNFKIICEQIMNRDCINHGMAYNIGFKRATGRIIIFQNSHCIYLGDILNFTIRNLKPNSYFNFNSFNIVDTSLFEKMLKTEKQAINYFENKKSADLNVFFCSAIYKSQLFQIGGYDLKFKYGLSSEQIQLNLIIKHILKLNVINVPTRYGCCINSNKNLNYDKDLIEKNKIILTNNYFKNKRLFQGAITLNEWQKSLNFNNLSLDNDEYIKELKTELDKLKNDINIFSKEKEKLDSINKLEDTIKNFQQKEITNTHILEKLLKEKERYELNKIKELESNISKLAEKKNSFLEKYPNINEIPVLEEKYRKQLKILNSSHEVQTRRIEKLREELTRLK
tara:strand:- start:618 stop:1793 length:1176 start_codon:yes stop_codon:yes gene_type:complete